MSVKEDPIAFLKTSKEKAVGFFLNVWKRIQEKKTLGQPSSEAQETVAVDLGQSHLLVLAMKKNGESPLVTHLRFEPRPSSLEGVSERLRIIFGEESLDPKNVRTALKGQGIVIRILTFPQMKKGDFSSAIRYEIEKYIPFKANEVLLDFQILRENLQRGEARFMEVLLVAVKQSEIYNLMRVFQNADLETKLVDVSALALANFVEFVTPEAKEKTIGFLDMGTDTTTFGILGQGNPVFIREISFGGTDILKLLKRRLALTPEVALQMQQEPAGKNPEYQEAVKQGIEAFLTELRISLSYYLDHVSGAQPLEKLLILGGGARFIPDLKFIEQEIKIPTERPKILPHLGIPPNLEKSFSEKNEDLLAVAVGLCLRP